MWCQGLNPDWQRTKQSLHYFSSPSVVLEATPAILRAGPTKYFTVRAQSQGTWVGDHRSDCPLSSDLPRHSQRIGSLIQYDPQENPRYSALSQSQKEQKQPTPTNQPTNQNNSPWKNLATSGRAISKEDYLKRTISGGRTILGRSPFQDSLQKTGFLVFPISIATVFSESQRQNARLCLFANGIAYFTANTQECWIVK